MGHNRIISLVLLNVIKLIICIITKLKGFDSSEISLGQMRPKST